MTLRRSSPVPRSPREGAGPRRGATPAPNRRCGGRPAALAQAGQAVKGNGKGGRNQELTLAAVDELAGTQDVLLITLATDGDDGPTDAAGACANGETRQRARRLGMSASDYLSRNDAYPFFEALGDLLKPGYTGTNVNDLIFLIGF